MYRSDDLMPDLFAGPYVFLEPDFAFVLDGASGRRSGSGRLPRPHAVARASAVWAVLPERTTYQAYGLDEASQNVAALFHYVERSANAFEAVACYRSSNRNGHGLRGRRHQLAGRSQHDRKHPAAGRPDGPAQ
jgi:hypothetical protein